MTHPSNVQFVPGEFLFKMKATRGVPLEMMLDQLFSQGSVVLWPGFIQEARTNGWWDFQTIKVIEHALVDAGTPKDVIEKIMTRCKLWVLKYPLKDSDNLSGQPQ